LSLLHATATTATHTLSLHDALPILGDVCTRACAYCNVRHGTPAPPDPQEADNLARAVETLGLDYVVITSVDRDDLPDFGAGVFADRKSTRLNSSHVKISYAVFCLKK